MNHPMGTLTLADLIGLDAVLFIPVPLLRKMVNAGWLGRKTGRGFYKK